MSVEQLISRTNIEGKKVPFMTRFPDRGRNPVSPASPIDFSQTPSRPVLHDTTKAREASRRKYEPEWQKRVGLVALAREKGFLKELSVKQQEAITTIFPEKGGHNSVSKAAEALHKSVPAIRSAFNLGMKQLESKETTGKFLKQGRRKKQVIDVSDSKGNKAKTLTRREREHDIVMKAIEAGTFFQLHKSQQEVLRAKCLGEKDFLPEGLDRRLISERKQSALKNLLNLEDGKPILKGRPRKLGVKRLFTEDSYLRKSKAIRIKRQMGKPRKQVDVSELQLLVSQGKNTNQIAKDLQSSWQTIARIAKGCNIQLPKLKRGQPRKIQSSFA